MLGIENPSDLGTKILNAVEIAERLAGMNLEAVLGKREGCRISFFKVGCARGTKHHLYMFNVVLGDESCFELFCHGQDPKDRP